MVNNKNNMTKDKLKTNSRFDALKSPSKNTKNQSHRVIRNKPRNKPKNKPSKIITQFTSKSEMFPELTAKPNTVTETKLNFAKAAKPIINDSVKKEDVKEGWVKINYGANNKIKYTYSKKDKKLPINSNNLTTNKGMDDEQYNMLENMVIRWEEYREHQNQMYEERSPFWNEKSLLEPLSDDCYSDTSESVESSICDTDEELDDLYDDLK